MAIGILLNHFQTDSIVSISIVTQPTTRTYTVNSSGNVTFDFTGAVVQAIYKSGKTETIIPTWAPSTSSITDTSLFKTVTITASYDSFTATTTMTVNNPVTSIAVSPTSAAYNVGATPSGTITATYTNGKTGTVTATTSPSTIAKGTTTVTFTYSGKTCTQTVTQTTIYWYNNGTWANGPTSIVKTDGSGAVTTNASNVVLTDWAGMPNHAFFALNQKIPLANTSTIYVRVQRSNTSDYSGQSFRFMVSTSSTAAGVQSGRAIGWTKPTSVTTLSLNVADFTDSKYLVFQDYNWNQTTTDTIYEIYGI